jgi:ribonucleoside-diphosphate reductase beta chain
MLLLELKSSTLFVKNIQNFLMKSLKREFVHEAEQAFVSESKIVDWMVNGIQEEGLTAAILKEFIKNRINESLTQIGFKKAFEVDKDLLKTTKWFDEELLGNNMTDFFHSRPVEYSKKNQSFDESDLF